MILLNSPDDNKTVFQQLTTTTFLDQKRLYYVSNAIQKVLKLNEALQYFILSEKL